MKNVIKIALLSTVAMVGTAQADLVNIGDIKTKINNIYATQDSSVASHASTLTAIDTLFSQIDQFYADNATATVTEFNWATYETTVETYYVNENAGQTADFSANIAAVQNSVRDDFWGGDTSTFSGLGDFSKVAETTGLYSDEAALIVTDHNAFLTAYSTLQGDYNDANLEAFTTAAQTLSTNVSGFGTKVGTYVTATNTFKTVDYNATGVANSYVPADATSVMIDGEEFTSYSEFFAAAD